MRHFNTVLGKIPENEVGTALTHEHICCYSEYLYQMAGSRYLDKTKLLEAAAEYLKTMKERYGLSTFVDCTAVNIGRDIELLKEVSRRTGVHIICSTGFYYTEETLFANLATEPIAEAMIEDAGKVNAGVIKCAVEQEKLTPFHEKILRATAMAQRVLKIPIVLHTNAKNRNGKRALEILLSEGVKAPAITVGHLSDTEDYEYVKQILRYGCYIGLDRLYGHTDEEYIRRKVESIMEYRGSGYEDRILLSHDALFFNGFEAEPDINPKPRFAYCFEAILPRLPKAAAEKIMKENPAGMLACGE